MTDIVHSIHWLSFTVHADNEAAFKLYEAVFQKSFGELISLDHGGRSYREIYKGLFEFKLYLTPANGQGQHFHFELPGQACEVIRWEIFQALIDYLEVEHQEKYTFKRIDIAFDYLNFTPEQVEQAIMENQLRSLAQRSKLNVNKSPLQTRDNGELGTYTVSLGSNTSQRMITVYNKRGYTRLEFQARDERAHKVAFEVLSYYNPDNWGEIAKAHLLDYIDIHTDWWAEFINGQTRANKTVTQPKELSIHKMYHWVIKQVAPSLSVLNDVLSGDVIDIVLASGRQHRGAKYDIYLPTDTTSQAEG